LLKEILEGNGMEHLAYVSRKDASDSKGKNWVVSNANTKTNIKEKAGSKVWQQVDST